MREKSRWALAAVVILAATAMSSCANAKNSAGTGTVWVATQGDQKLTSFSINLTSGALSKVGNPVATGVTPAALAMTPDQKTVFLANSGDGSISVYNVHSDGSLSSSNCSSCTAGQSPVALAVDPSGTFLFAANQGTFTDSTSGTVSVFKISSGGLAAVTTFPTETSTNTTGTGPSGIVVSPVSFSCNIAAVTQTCYALYVANQFTNTVSAYEFYVDSSGNFNLQGAGASSYPVGNNPTGLAFSRCAGVSKATTHCATADGNNLFVTNSGSSDVTTFTACIQAVSPCPAADGSLLPVSGTTAAGIRPIFVIVNPAADFVYTVDKSPNSGQVSQFSYSPVTAALTPLTPPAVSTAAAPSGGGITSDGSLLIVPNNGSSNMSVYRINLPTSSGSNSANGRLVPASPATVSLSGQPSTVLVK